ncbi:MAG: hypothetical protein GXO72_06210 [Caldiserica bacterium]|nr:hypothetical protein [Caldisericota bacterium]
MNGAFRAADSLGFRAELSRMDALYRWATAVSGVWGGLEITLGLEDAGGGLGCSGSVLAAGDVWSIELRGAYSPAAGWDLWVSLGLSLDVY